MDNQELFKMMKDYIADGKLTCDHAHQIAERHGVKLWQIGQICEEQNIKIKSCQLGCFK